MVFLEKAKIFVLLAALVNKISLPRMFETKFGGLL